MAVNYITVKGYIKNGELQIDLPENVIDGEVDIKLPVMPNETPLTDEEFKEALKFHPVPASEIETGGWEDLEISDSADWINKQKQQRRERKKWSL